VDLIAGSGHARTVAHDHTTVKLIIGMVGRPPSNRRGIYEARDEELSLRSRDFDPAGIVPRCDELARVFLGATVGSMPVTTSPFALTIHSD